MVGNSDSASRSGSLLREFGNSWPRGSRAPEQNRPLRRDCLVVLQHFEIVTLHSELRDDVFERDAALGGLSREGCQVSDAGGPPRPEAADVGAYRPNQACLSSFDDASAKRMGLLANKEMVARGAGAQVAREPPSVSNTSSPIRTGRHFCRL